ncbi:hypothetical protein M422DRAFT_251805 [Sphaerobolus stellatus SS14]|uniref:Uncharacterized protein n=1 Tax=Sphaerobolus stellatus (strain SS14) TaxID=990650 RepID=A0A0C9VCW0_SPHS4|nr:hypothetical protein M422DRAFT_251805 [Sphaerobolus stellatus SS14]
MSKKMNKGADPIRVIHRFRLLLQVTGDIFTQETQMPSKCTKFESSDGEFPEEDTGDSKPLKFARLNKEIDNSSKPGSIAPYTKSLYLFEVNPMVVLVAEGTAFRPDRCEY